MQLTDWISAGAAVASVAVALIIGFVALRIAAGSNGIARRALGIAEEAREISRDSVRQASRSAILASVPHLVAERPIGHGVPPARYDIKVTNGGPTVAYGILASVAGAAERSIEAADESTRAWSGRQPALKPDAPPLTLTVRMAKPADYPWLHSRIEYVSPLGARVRHDHIGPSNLRDLRYRLHLVTIDPADGSEPLRFPIELGPFDDEPDLRPPAVIA